MCSLLARLVCFQGSKFYSALRLDQVRSELNIRAKAGSHIQHCPDCKQKAVIDDVIQERSQPEFQLIAARCLVCASNKRRVSLHCPDCKELMSCYEGDMKVTCEACQEVFERYELLNDDAVCSAVDDEYLPAGCTFCLKEGAVAKFGGGYLCTECLNFYDQIEVCSCCDYASDSVPEFSHIRGCEFCDGDSRYLED